MNIEDTIFDDGMAINSLVGATRCRIVECTWALAWSTRHVPAGSLRGRACHALCGRCEAPRTMYRIGFEW